MKAQSVMPFTRMANFPLSRKGLSAAAVATAFGITAFDTTDLGDVYLPSPFNDAMMQRITESNNFLNSGIMITSEELANLVAQGGWTFDLPHFNPLSSSGEPNYDSDDPATDSVPGKIGTGVQKGRVFKANKSWSVMDLAAALGHPTDPLGAIGAAAGDYWVTQIQKRAIQTAMGVLADNTQNDSSDMLASVATDSADAITDSERISGDAIIDAAQTLGDSKMNVVAIAMHSVVHSRLQKQNLITTIRNSDNSVRWQEYLGYRVFIDDALPAVMGSNRITYTSILFGYGALSWAPAPNKVPSEPERKPSAGHGGGETILHTRMGGLIHPNGYAVSTDPASTRSYTLAELAAHATWDRIYERKNVNLAFLQTNG